MIERKTGMKRRLSDIAFIFGGEIDKTKIPYKCVKGEKYIEITNSCISNGLIHLGSRSYQRQVDAQMQTEQSCDDFLLRDGDIVIRCSIKGNDEQTYGLGWGIYRGMNKISLPKPNLLVVRPDKQFKEEVLLLFNTKKGLLHVREELERVKKDQKNRPITRNDLRNIVLPDIIEWESEPHIFEQVYTLDKLIDKFSQIGWTPILNKKIGDRYYYFTLDYKDRTYIIFESHVYSMDELKKPTIIDRFKDNLAVSGALRYYVVCDGRLFYFENDCFVCTDEIPDPLEFTNDKGADQKRSSVVEAKDSVTIITLLRQLYEGVKSTSIDIKRLSVQGEKLSATTESIEKKVDDINQKLDYLIQQTVKQISGLKSFAHVLLSRTESDEETERIMRAFTDECAESISNVVGREEEIRDIKNEEERLKGILGDIAWKKLDSKTITFLTSARVMYDSLSRMEGDIDYSGVCLLLCKAVEVEAHIRFFQRYLEFLEKKYGKNAYEQFPSNIVEQKKGKWQTRDFTLGSVPHVLCCKYYSHKLEDETILYEYMRERLLTGKSKEEIRKILKYYSDEIETLANKYRNPCAHKEAIAKISATKCFELVLDVQKLLRKMLETFDE